MSVPVAITAAEVAKIVKEFMPELKELGQWLIAESQKDRTIVSRARVESVTKGRNLTFELWDVDDRAEIVFEGMRKVCKMGETERVTRPVQVGPKNVVVLDHYNTGGGPFKARFRVGDPTVGYPLIDFELDDDEGIMGLQRLYMWTFDVKG